MALRADDVDLERDRALVRRFQAGDGDAFDELYRRYHGRLERFCRKRVGDQHIAEDLTQEAFTRALTALPELSGELRFYPWVSVIAARLCVDCYRRQSRSEPAADPDPGLVAGGQEDIVDAVDASLVVEALARLAPRHQDVLHLREVEGWSYQRIADHYGVKVGTVETLLFRARRALRREFHLVDGAGLTALPVLGRLMRLAAHARSRIPSWLPSAPSPASVAAATAAAVALAVVPGRLPGMAAVAPITPHAIAPVDNHLATSVGGRTIASMPSPVAATASASSVSSAPETFVSSPTPTGPAPTVTPTATTLVPPVGVASRAVANTAGANPIGSALAAVPPLTVPSSGPLVGSVAPVHTPALPLTTPPADILATSSTVLGAAESAVSHAVRGVLPGI